MELQMYQFMFGNSQFCVASANMTDAYAIALTMCGNNINNKDHLQILPFVTSNIRSLPLTQGFTIH